MQLICLQLHCPLPRTQLLTCQNSIHWIWKMSSKRMFKKKKKTVRLENHWQGYNSTSVIWTKTRGLILLKPLPPTFTPPGSSTGASHCRMDFSVLQATGWQMWLPRASFCTNMLLVYLSGRKIVFFQLPVGQMNQSRAARQPGSHLPMCLGNSATVTTESGGGQFAEKGWGYSWSTNKYNCTPTNLDDLDKINS